MSNFSKIKIADIGLTITGKTPSSKNPEDFGFSETMFVTPSDSFDKKTMNSTERYLSIEGVRKLSNKLLPLNSVMVTCIGSAMGKVTMNAKRCITNQQINSIIPNDNHDSNYIYYALKNNYKLLRNASSGSTALPILNKTDFDLLEIVIHNSKKSQQKIAAALSSLDAKIELNNRINAELEKMAKTLYDYWFVQFDFPDANGKPYKSSGGKMLWNEELKREIPDGWEVKNLFSSKYIKLVSTGINKFEGEKTYLSTSEVENSQIINHSIKTNYLNRKSRANMQPKPKTIWFARMKDTKKIILIDDYCDDLIENYIFSTGFAGLETSKDFLYFLWCFINSKDFEDIKNRHATGTTQKSITNEGIEKIKILIPSQDLLNIFDSKLSNFYQKIYVNNKQNQTLAELRDWLLPMLMNGQVKVD